MLEQAMRAAGNKAFFCVSVYFWRNCLGTSTTDLPDLSSYRFGLPAKAWLVKVCFFIHFSIFSSFFSNILCKQKLGDETYSCKASNTLLFPFCITTNHWGLVLMRPSKGEVAYMDSMGFTLTELQKPVCLRFYLFCLYTNSFSCVPRLRC